MTRNTLASLVLATSILAHGYARARQWMHHVFGGVLVVIILIFAVPTAVARRLGRAMRGTRPENFDA